jgi:rubrerythrin
MENEAVTDEDRRKARQCLHCPICGRARRKQKGLAYWFVKKVESGFCPACKAYEKVYQRKAHEPIPEAGDNG